MYLFRRDHQATARKALVPVPLPYIYYIVFNVCGNHEKRVLMASDVQALALADSIELGSLVTAYYSTVRI